MNTEYTPEQLEKIRAAAPELLEALEECLKLISRNFCDSQRFKMQDKIKAVIKKATE